MDFKAVTAPEPHGRPRRHVNYLDFDHRPACFQPAQYLSTPEDSCMFVKNTQTCEQNIDLVNYLELFICTLNLDQTPHGYYVMILIMMAILSLFAVVIYLAAVHFMAPNFVTMQKVLGIPDYYFGVLVIGGMMGAPTLFYRESFCYRPAETISFLLSDCVANGHMALAFGFFLIFSRMSVETDGGLAALNIFFIWGGSIYTSYILDSSTEFNQSPPLHMTYFNEVLHSRILTVMFLLYYVLHVLCVFRSMLEKKKTKPPKKKKKKKRPTVETLQYNAPQKRQKSVRIATVDEAASQQIKHSLDSFKRPASILSPVPRKESEKKVKPPPLPEPVSVAPKVKHPSKRAYPIGALPIYRFEMDAIEAQFFGNEAESSDSTTPDTSPSASPTSSSYHTPHLSDRQQASTNSGVTTKTGNKAAPKSPQAHTSAASLGSMESQPLNERNESLDLYDVHFRALTPFAYVRKPVPGTKFVKPFVFPFWFILGSMICVVDQKREVKGWCKYLVVTSLLYVPLLCTLLGAVIWFTIVAAILVAVIVAYVWITTSAGEPPPYYLCFSILGAGAGTLFTYRIGIEFDALLYQILSYTETTNTDISAARLLSFGEALSACFTCYALATPRHRFKAIGAIMSLTVIYTYMAIPYVVFDPCYAGLHQLTQSANRKTAFIMAFITLFFTLISILQTNFTIRPSHGYFTLIMFIMFHLFHILSIRGLIHPYGTNHDANQTYNAFVLAWTL